VLDNSVTLPEGLEVSVAIPSSESEHGSPDDHGQTLGEKLLKHAGKATGLPPDAALNHDHYLYGTPKK